MAKEWKVKIDDKMHTVKMKGKKAEVDGERIALKKYRQKMGLLHEEYVFPVGSKSALLVIKNMSAPQLVIDGIDCATGEQYVPFKVPGWAYVFIVLHLINFLNGAIGWMAVVIGIGATTSISCNTKMNIAVRVLLNIVVLVLVYAVVFGLAFALVNVAY